MSKAVLISVRPEWCEKILAGEKTMEVRKTRPRLETPFKVYIYCTLAASKEFKLDDHNWDVFARNYGGWPDRRGHVIAEFTCDEIDCVDIPYPAYQNLLNEKYLRESCVPYYDLHWRFGHDNAYFWHISDLKIYDNPRKLEEFIGLQSMRLGMRPIEVQRPPQSWRYVREELKNE